MAERVLIYGSRTWRDDDAIRYVVMGLNPDTVVIHGGAAGADHIAGRWAKAYGFKVEVYPAQWDKHGKAAGPIRNQRMIDEGKPTKAYGFRLGEKSPGTDDMTRRLQQAGIETWLTETRTVTPSTAAHEQRAATPGPEPAGQTGRAGGVMAWDHITITLMHYYPPSKGARVLVTSGGRFVVRSASGEGMTVDDPNIQSFLAWARDYYQGAKFQEVSKP